MTYDQNITNMYVDGIFVGSSTNKTGTLTSKTNLFIASTVGSTEFNTMLYNRALTAAEVLQNYNATRARYI